MASHNNHHHQQNGIIQNSRINNMSNLNNNGNVSGSGNNKHFLSRAEKLEKPPLPNDPAGIYSHLVSDTDLTLAKKKFIKVSGVGEIEVEADKIDFSIQITSIKSDMVEARASAKKREDYVLAILKKNLIINSMEDVSVNDMVTKVTKTEQESEEDVGVMAMAEEGNNQNQTKKKLNFIFKLTRELHIQTDNLLKYLQIFSICNEKLDSSVNVSEPVIKFTPARMQTYTQKALRQSVGNALMKANELITSQKTSNLILGQLIYCLEESLLIQNQDEYSTSQCDMFKLKKYGKRITVKTTSVYEIINTPQNKIY